MTLDARQPDGTTTTETHWDCAMAWPIFLHEVTAKNINRVRGEVEAFRKSVDEAKPSSPLGIIALSYASMADTVHRAVTKRNDNAFMRFFRRKTVHDDDHKQIGGT